MRVHNSIVIASFNSQVKIPMHDRKENCSISRNYVSVKNEAMNIPVAIVMLSTRIEANSNNYASASTNGTKIRACLT